MSTNQQNNESVLDRLDPTYVVHRALADGALVMTHATVTGSDGAEDDFGYTCSTGVFGNTPFVFHDLFQIASGRAVEHEGAMVGAESRI